MPRVFLQETSNETVTLSHYLDLLPGIGAFAKAFPVKRQLLVGAQGIPLEDFLTQPLADWVE